MAVGIGFKNLKYCLMDDETAETYAPEVKSLGNVISFKLTPETSSVELYADDGLSESSNVLVKYNLEITIKNIDPEVESDILGHAVDTVNGGIVVKSTDVAPFMAIYGVKTFNDGTEKPFWLTKVKFAEPNEENQTKGAEIEFQTFTLTATGYARLRDRVPKHSILSTDPLYDAAAYMSKPYELPPDVAVTGVTVSESTKTVNVNDTFTLTAEIAPPDATNKKVTWSSDDPTVATVTQGGLVKALKTGNANITVTTQDGAKTDTCAVTVS